MHQVLRACKDSQDLQVCLEHQEPRDQEAFQDLRAIKETLDQREDLESQDQQD